MKLDGLGIWTAQLDFQPTTQISGIAHELDTLRYGSLWIGENVGREPFSQPSLLLANTDRLVIGIGIANIWARDPLIMLAGQIRSRKRTQSGSSLDLASATAAW